MTDALSILRTHIASNLEIIHDEEENVLKMGEQSFPLSEPTYYRSQKGSGPYYTLEQIWLFYQNRSLSHGEYIGKFGSAAVSFVDRKDLLAYMSGDIATSKAIKPPKTTAVASSVASSSSVDVAAAAKENADDQVDDNNKVKDSLAKPDDSATTPQPDKTKRTAQDSPKQSASKKARTGAMSVEETELFAATQEIIRNERTLRNRKSILRTAAKRNGQAFFTGFIEEAKHLRNLDKLRIEYKKRQEIEERRRAQPNAYDRYNVREKEFWKERISDTQEFGIDTTGTFAAGIGGITGLADDAAPTQEQTEEEKALAAHQKELERMEEEKRRLEEDQRLRTPIIIVPNGDAPVAIQNAKLFFENASWAPPQGDALLDEFVVKHNGVNWRVMSSHAAASKLRTDDWKNRVVAVICRGMAWQFKGWGRRLGLEDPVALFQLVAGFQFEFDDEKAVASKWAVTKLTLSRQKRHLDKTCVLKFWNAIERWCRVHRPELRIKK